MNSSTKYILAASLLGTISVAGVSHLVSAAQIKTPTAVMPEHHSNNQKIQASDGDGETKDDFLGQLNNNEKETSDEKEQANEQREDVKLQTLAKITSQQAQKAAELAQGGKSNSVKLENENGNLIYTVEIGQKEVAVDAGNGRVLYTEPANQPEDKKTEMTRPRSSIQVSEAPGGDGDGETNDDG